jgi:hypothetical protein
MSCGCHRAFDALAHPKVSSAFRLILAGEEIERHALGGVYGAQKLHQLVSDLFRGFVLYPVAHVVDFEIPHETGEAGTEFFDGWIKCPQAIRLPRNVKGRLGDFRAFQAPDK